MDLQAFYQGLAFDAHEWLGAHVGHDGVTFRVLAPAAAGITLRLANGQGPCARELPLMHALDGNFFELTVADARPGDAYEYRVWHADGSFTDHCDPYGFQMELRPAHRSIVCDLEAAAGDPQRDDGNWARIRPQALRHDRPLNIYELHLGSWRKPSDDPESWYTYRELAQPLVDHLLAAGYNAVEFMPALEHPADESWGYQNTGFFAATSRYGTPADLMALIDALHAAGIAVLLDFVPVHFACDPYGLARFDGQALYEYPHEAVGVSEWGSSNFMHSRGEVRSFIQSAAAFWLGTYGFDGLRMDAVSRLIYWQGDERRGVNGSAIEFLKTMNAGLKARFPERLLIAEDSTAFPGVTAAVDHGGLGFDYKWDLGWMHDTLSLFQMPPAERRANYHKLTFSLMYFYNERYLLPLSHDENVHGKATVLQKMDGGYDGKFPQARCLYLYMAAHPGKTLTFMGSELGQLREWDEHREQDWCLLGFPVHDGFFRFMRDLGHVYLEHPALWARDYEPSGFFWLDCHQEQRLLYAFVRRGGAGCMGWNVPGRAASDDCSGAPAEDELVACILNLDDHPHEDYRVPLSADLAVRSCRTLINTDWQRYGGALPDGADPVRLMAGEVDATSEASSAPSLVCDLAPHTAVLVQLIRNDTGTD